jgi:hypothetical protein
MSPDTVTDKRRLTNIEKCELDGKILDWYKGGMKATKITKRINEEGYTDIDLRQVRYFINQRYKKPKIKEKKDKEERSVSAELKLHESIQEALKNYDSCKDGSGNIKSGKEKEALEWHKEYQGLLEKLIKTEGLYEKAKQDAQKEDDKKIEVIWKFVTVCEKCQNVIDEEVAINSTMSLSDMQVEDVKDTIVKEMTEEVKQDGDGKDQ